MDGRVVKLRCKQQTQGELQLWRTRAPQPAEPAAHCVAAAAATSSLDFEGAHMGRQGSPGLPVRSPTEVMFLRYTSWWSGVGQRQLRGAQVREGSSWRG